MLRRSAQKLDPREQHHWIESPRQGMQLFLRYLPPLSRQTGEVRPILYLHGATFPSALSIAHRLWIFEPISRDERAAASEPTTLSHSGRERAARGGSPFHSQLAWSAESFAHQPLVGFNAGWPFRRTASHNGGPHGVIWRHHPPAAAQIRKAARGAGMADRDR